MKHKGGWCQTMPLSLHREVVNVQAPRAWLCECVAYARVFVLRVRMSESMLSLQRRAADVSNKREVPLPQEHLWSSGYDVSLTR